MVPGPLSGSPRPKPGGCRAMGKNCRASALIFGILPDGLVQLGNTPRRGAKKKKLKGFDCIMRLHSEGGAREGDSQK
jgi:hypothetical protein